MDRVIENIISGFVALDLDKLRKGDEAEWHQFAIRQANAKYLLEEAPKDRSTESEAVAQEVAELRAALEFYAAPENWWCMNAGGFGHHQAGNGSMERLNAKPGTVSQPPRMIHPQFHPDCGDRAREVLARRRGTDNG